MTRLCCELFRRGESLTLDLHGVDARHGRHGSVSNYLVRELGVGAKDIAKLRTLYLE
jgi:hypothetical protein